MLGQEVLMVIDPRLYEKLSGRKGDPYDRLGQALADNSKREQSRGALKDRTAGELLVEGHVNALKVRWIIGIVVSLAVLVALAFGFLK
jgi:hypothetical protein